MYSRMGLTRDWKHCLDILDMAACQVPPEEGEAVVGLLCGGGDMRVHVEFLVYEDAQVLSSFNHLELTAVDGVCCLDGVSLPGYADHLTL